MFLENHIENAMTAFIKLIPAMQIKDLNRKLTRRIYLSRDTCPDDHILAVQWMQQVQQKCISNPIWSVPLSSLNQHNLQEEPDFHGGRSDFHLVEFIDRFQRT